MAKQIGEPTGAWHLHGNDGLTYGGSAGVRPPLVELGLTSVGPVDLNPNAIRAPFDRLTAQVQRSRNPNQ